MEKPNSMIIRFIVGTCRPWRILFTLVWVKLNELIPYLIEWPDGNYQDFYNAKVNQVLEVNYSDSQKKVLILRQRCHRRCMCRKSQD